MILFLTDRKEDTSEDQSCLTLCLFLSLLPYFFEYCYAMSRGTTPTQSMYLCVCIGSERSNTVFTSFSMAAVSVY